MLITEAGTGTPDYVEVQNVTDHAIDTSGWYLVVNKGTGPGYGLNAFNYSKTCFPASLAPGEVAYWTDSATEHYVGFSDIPFGSSGRGWAMIMDSQGNVVDFAAWVYSAADIAAMNITVDGHNVRGSGFGAARACWPRSIRTTIRRCTGRGIWTRTTGRISSSGRRRSATRRR